ncbi:MAG: substrate-binding domain-containing protein [Betaproteobacteria bacterium]|nr:substrate-binding domain-containing protein [Betaproteobacteria bacterium]
MLRVVCSGLAVAALLSIAGTGCVGAEEVRVGGTGSALGTLQLLAKAFSTRHPGIAVRFLPSLGSTGGVRAVGSGALDIAVTSRPLKPDELRLGLSEIEFGRTPFVIAVAASSPVLEISLAQLAAIYAGRQTTWPDGSLIRVVLRPPSDSDSETLKSFSGEIREAVSLAEQRPGLTLAVTDQDAADDLEKIPGAIGSTSLSLILSEQRGLRALKLDDRIPSAANLGRGAYPYFKRLFLVMRAKRSTYTDTFIAFVHSPEGRKMLTDSGLWLP